MAANSQQFWTRTDQNPKRVHEVRTSSLENRVEELTSLVRQFISGGQQQQLKPCGICSIAGHATDMCPTLHEETNQQANAAGVFPGPAQQKYDPYSNSYNPGWRNHPNFSYGNNQNRFQQPFQPQLQPQPRPPVTHSPTTPIEDIVKMLATNTLQF